MIPLPRLLLCCLALADEPEAVRPYGLTTRPDARPFLNLPADGAARPPVLLSRTGAFADVRSLSPAPSLIPYEVNVPFWSDGAE